MDVQREFEQKTAILKLVQLPSAPNEELSPCRV